ncbi:MAG: T9SS type A sorting domain-containing protein [Bacteroidia bacterium]
MKTIITTLSLFFICFTSSNAQVIGDVAVCSGYTYNYSVTPIPGAVNYIWYFPNGWYDITGQGTTNVTVTCNTSGGNIYCEGYNAAGNLITTPTINTHFGDGGIGGWDVQPSAIAGCNSTPFSVSVVPNGTGNGGACSGGCGSGTVHPNIHFALYDDVWPNGQFIVFADGISTAIVGLNVGAAYVYQVDVTNGYNPPQAIQISGACGSEVINNVCNISVYPPLFPGFSQTPSAPCIGDTVLLYETTGITNPCWGCLSNITGLNVIGSFWTNPLTAIVTNSNPTADVTGLDANGCTTYDTYNVNANTCTSGSIVGDTIVCSGYTYSYAATIPGAVTYNWTFPNGWYNITGQGTANVTATCNVNIGNVCVQGFDGGGSSLGTTCIATQFGGGTPVGWDVQPQQPFSCPGIPINLNIVPNGSGSGSCPNGCGNGMPVLNLSYAVYDSVWPFGNFLGFADGSSLPVPMIPGIYSYYIYYIDYTAGTSTSLAVRIEGACGTATNNNVVQLTIPSPSGPGFLQFPTLACVGDTVNVTAFGASSGSFQPIIGMTMINNSGMSFTAIINSLIARALFTGIDFQGCNVSEICYINTGPCSSNTLTGDTIVCDGVTYNYSVNISGAVTYDWLFPPGWYNITGQGTANASATCNGSNGWISVTGSDASGNILANDQLLAQIGSPSFCSGNAITGDTILCAGYIYNYSASITGAVNYTWTFPSGWYDITGQGTSNVTATCNINDGNICVEGFDAGGNSLGTECIATTFGGGGATGWDVQPQLAQGCLGTPFTFSIVPNGTGGGPGCPPGCGNGILHPNIHYCIYDNIWPLGNFLGYADGTWQLYFGGFGGPVYVYLCDVTLGTSSGVAVKIDGGCGGGIVNNVAIVTPYPPTLPFIIQTPPSACVGDTISLNDATPLTNPGWGFMGSTAGLTFLNGPYANPLIAVITSTGAQTDVTGIDFNGCPLSGPVSVSYGTCALIPVAALQSSDTVFCDKQSINFNDLSTNNPTSWQWTFQGAAPSTSTDQNPQNIYYATSGSFDVTLIACNSAGCDTLMLTGFIVEHNAAYDSIYKSNDTLYSIPASTYQWYEVSSGIITGATSQYYVPAIAGNYYCVIFDSIGCSDASNTISITTGIDQVNNFFSVSVTPNPNKGIFELQLNSFSKIKNLRAQIINVLGEIVFEKSFENVNGKLMQQIDLGFLPKGVYSLQLMSDERSFSQKIILN